MPDRLHVGSIDLNMCHEGLSCQLTCEMPIPTKRREKGCTHCAAFNNGKGKGDVPLARRTQSMLAGKRHDVSRALYVKEKLSFTPQNDSLQKVTVTLGTASFKMRDGFPRAEKGQMKLRCAAAEVAPVLVRKLKARQ